MSRWLLSLLMVGLLTAASSAEVKLERKYLPERATTSRVEAKT